VLIHVFQVQVAELGVGTQELVELLHLGIIERTVAPAGQQLIALVVREQPSHQL
jgi:hypothetical protein